VEFGRVSDPTVRLTLDGVVLTDQAWGAEEVHRQFQARASKSAFCIATCHLADRSVLVSVTPPEVLAASVKQVRIEIVDAEGETATEKTIPWPEKAAVTEAALNVKGMPPGLKTVRCALLGEQGREINCGKTSVYILADPPE